MKVVFLDIDGVLNCNRSRTSCAGHLGVDGDKIKRLKRIVDETGAKIVLISTWKERWYRNNKIRQGIMANYLDSRFRRYGLEIYDKTAVRDIDKRILTRGEGILQYLENKGVEDFVIIDDLQFDYDRCSLTDRWIATDFDEGGLADEHASLAIKILNNGL